MSETIRVYRCGICGKDFDNTLDRAKCEIECDKKIKVEAEKQKQENLKAEKEKRIAELESAYEEYQTTMDNAYDVYQSTIKLAKEKYKEIETRFQNDYFVRPKYTSAFDELVKYALKL